MTALPQNMTTSVEDSRATIPEGLPLSDLSRIQKSFELLAPRGEEMASRFYGLLFLKFPETRSFFNQSQMPQQHLKFLNGLRSLILQLENPDELRALLLRLGKRHREYGVEFQHYPPVVDTLIQVLQECGGSRIDGKTYEAWDNLLHLIRAIMLENQDPDSPLKGLNGRLRDTMVQEQRKRILLIDDDRQLLDLYQSYLEIQGYFCSHVTDIPWAFTHIQMSRYDLVLTDFQMPGMTGIQIRKALDWLGVDWCPPFVLMTGNLSPEVRKQALESGFMAAMKKPHDLNELGSVIRTAIKRVATLP